MATIQQGWVALDQHVETIGYLTLDQHVEAIGYLTLAYHTYPPRLVFNYLWVGMINIISWLAWLGQDSSLSLG